MLTKRMKQVYDFVAKTIVETGKSPTYDEISFSCDIYDRAAVCNIVDRIVARGFLRKTPHISRGLSIARKLPISRGVYFKPTADGRPWVTRL